MSLNQGAFVQSTARLSWSAAGKAVIPDLDPCHVFTTYIQGKITDAAVFGDDAGSTGRRARAARPDRRSTAKPIAQKSILDYVIADLNRFGKIVGTADKASIDPHLTYVRDIEKGLGVIGTGGASGAGGSGGMVIGGSGAACAIPAAATANPVAYKSTDNIPVVAKLHMDLGIVAFAADLTRIAVMQIGDQGAAQLIMSWSPLNFKSPAGRTQGTRTRGT